MRAARERIQVVSQRRTSQHDRALGWPEARIDSLQLLHRGRLTESDGLLNLKGHHFGGSVNVGLELRLRDREPPPPHEPPHPLGDFAPNPLDPEPADHGRLRRRRVQVDEIAFGDRRESPAKLMRFLPAQDRVRMTAVDGEDNLPCPVIWQVEPLPEESLAFPLDSGDRLLGECISEAYSSNVVAKRGS